MDTLHASPPPCAKSVFSLFMRVWIMTFCEIWKLFSLIILCINKSNIKKISSERKTPQPGTTICQGVYTKWCMFHYDDVIMMAIASQITSLTIVYSAVYSGAHQRKHQSSASLAFVWGIHRGPVNSPHKWPVTRKMFPFDDVIMLYNIKTNGANHCDLLITYSN